MKCVVCGKEFEPRKTGGRPQITCSDECQIKRMRERAKKHNQEQNHHKKIVRQVKKTVNSSKEITEAQRAAAEHGMSYGMYQAYLWQKERQWTLTKQF